MLTPSRAAERKDPRWWTFARLPPEVAEFDAADRADEPGAPGSPRRGSVGLLDLDFATVAGATRLVRQYHRTPLYILRPIHLDECRPDMAFVYVQQQGDGLLQGDRCRLDVDVGESASVHLTTQAATKIYRMDTGYASQLVNITAGPGAFVEYLPEPVMPFAGSRFAGSTVLTVDPEAIVLYGEMLLPGRAARGERHDYDLYYATTRIHRPGGEQLAADTLSFRGRSADAGGRADTPARLGAHPVHANFFALAPEDRVGPLLERWRECLHDCPGIVGGVTRLPSGAGLLARVLGPSSLPVRAAQHLLWDTARRQLVGSPAPDLRRD